MPVPQRAAAAHLKADVPPSPSQAVLPPPPVLVVEDDDAIRNLIVMTLMDQGYAVLATANGETALETLGQQAPSAILLDLNMPVMDGRGFLAAYRALPGPHAPVIVCAATYRCEDVAEQLGAEDCLPKPFTLEDLLEVVGRHAAPPVPVTVPDTAPAPTARVTRSATIAA